jgi:hypothetical protein
MPDTVFGVVVAANDTAIVDLALQAYDFLSGDANCDNHVNGIDVTFMVNYFKGGQAPCDPLLRGDANGNCLVNGIDVVYMVSYLKGLGPAPVRGDCGPQ